MKVKNIYPCFQSEFKCVETYNVFTQGVDYKITGFGTDMRNGKKVDVWFIIEADFNEDNVEFSVIKTTVNRLVDKGIIKIIYESNSSL